MFEITNSRSSSSRMYHIYMLRTSCSMKPIEVKQRALSRFLLTRLGGAGIGSPEEIENYIRIFVRLVDKAIQEYNEIYDFVIEEINEAKRPVRELEKGRILYAHFIVNELENCINTTKRALNIVEKLSQNKNTPFAIEKILRRYINSLHGRLTPIRNIVEHIDSAIEKGEIQKGKSIIIDLSEDASTISIGDLKLATADLASLLQKLYELALEIGIFNAPTTYKKNLTKIIDKKNTLLNK